jgi:hypothetical protein
MQISKGRQAEPAMAGLPRIGGVGWDPPSAVQVKAYLPAAVAVLSSGFVMMVAGYLFHGDGWAVAGPVMFPAGILISFAFYLARRANNETRRRGRVSGRTVVLVLLGVPAPGADLSLIVSIAVSATTLAAGAVMVVAGYAIAAWSVFLVPPLLLAAGAVIVIAFVVADRAGRPGLVDPEVVRSEPF